MAAAAVASAATNQRTSNHDDAKLVRVEEENEAMAWRELFFKLCQDDDTAAGRRSEECQNSRFGTWGSEGRVAALLKSSGWNGQAAVIAAAAAASASEAAEISATTATTRATATPTTSTATSIATSTATTSMTAATTTLPTSTANDAPSNENRWLAIRDSGRNRKGFAQTFLSSKADVPKSRRGAG
eukprot:TRINITY_DN7978_c0_g1_i1.p1 TRINITY_DN7978_c0_g1~~TRINITY_DN7978_c0_g1_i1.p1  ORF type:complete len:206 (+),score=63.18 TRINITY_DN7978_c0_g1_i1:61-618(+)